FVAGDVAVADFLRGIVSGAADAELDECRVVMEVVHLVVNRAVLRIGPDGALGRSPETAMLDRIIVALLRVPFEVVAEIADIDPVTFEQTRVRREIGRE